MGLWNENGTSKAMLAGTGNPLTVLSNNIITLLNPFALYHAPLINGNRGNDFFTEPSYCRITEHGNIYTVPRNVVASNVNFEEGDVFGVDQREPISDNHGWSSELFWVYLINCRTQEDGEVVLKSWGPFNISDIPAYYNAIPGSTLPAAKTIDPTELSIRELSNSIYSSKAYYTFQYPSGLFNTLITETYVPPQEHSSKVTVSTLSHYHSKLDNDIFTPLDEIISNTAVDADINELF